MKELKILKRKTYEELKNELEQALLRLDEANEAIQAIRTGQIDALVVETAAGPQLYSIKTADHTYRLFIEKMSEGAVTLNKEGIILYSNSQFASIVNLPLSKIIGLPIVDLIPAEYKAEFNKMLIAGWRSNCQGEIFFQGNNNELVPFLLSFTPLELDQGADALCIIFTNISTQKENEKELRIKNEQLSIAQQNLEKINDELEDIVQTRTRDLLRSREHFKFLADNIPVIVWTTDPEGKLDYVNEQWIKYTGFDCENSRTKQIELVHPDDLACSSAAWKESLKSKKKFEHEYRFKRASDGSYRWHFAKAIPFKDENENVITWIGSSIDIDYQKRELEKKDEFISMASHELKTPMTSLKGYLQLIETQRELPEKVVLYLEKANTSFNKLQHLINDLLDVSKIKAGKLKFDMEWIDLSELVDTCIESSRHIYSSFTIKKELQKDVYIEGNGERLEQVMMNLVSNAVKYSPNNKEIIIRVVKNSHHAIVSVRDFGIGMSSADQKKIFERFYRVEDNKLGIPGLGMGLYICSEIIKEHQGELSVESKLNEGSQLSFSIPLAEK